MNKEREICGVKVIVSGETYNEYKGTLEEQLEEKDKEIERLNNIISIKTTYIEDLLKSILKSTDIKIQREVYEHGIEYDRKLKELKEGK